MIKKLKEAQKKFIYHFGYYPEFPPTIEFNQELFADELLKCVEDDFDYTVEKYGTKVKKEMPRPEIIYD